MVSKSTYQDLLRDKLTLTTALENNPIYIELQLVTRLLELYEKQAGVLPDTEDTKSRPGQVSTDEEKELMVEAAVNHWLKTDNAATTIKKLSEKLIADGIEIKGDRPGTTLGAVVSKRGATFELIDKKNGLWKMTNEAFEAAKRKAAAQ